MENFKITLDPEQYPMLSRQYSEKALQEQLVSLCKFHYKGGEITEARLYSVAGMLESDLQHDLG